jgi:Receptor L domain
MHPRVDIVRTSTPIRSVATTGSHSSSPLARTLLNLDSPMRFTTLLIALTPFVAACLGEQGGSRKPGDRDTTDPTSTTEDTCAKVEKDITIRTAADTTTLPKTGCYDIYGKLTLQGSVVTSLVMLNGLNSVNELDLDHTGLTTIDSKRPIGIYGKLTVTGNAKLTNLKQLSFETASTGILIDGNTVLATLDPLGLDDPKLAEVDGDIAITGNAALTQVPLKNLTKVTGALTITGNTVVKTVDLSNLATTGHVELADNPQLTSLTGFAATTINGDFAIRNNTALTTLGTMSSLYRVTGNLTIDGNAALTNLAAFTTSVKFVDLMLTITNNQNLVDLGALKHLQLVGAITITNNQNLVTCRATEIDRCTQHPTTAVISNNKNTNCNWQCN